MLDKPQHSEITFLPSFGVGQGEYHQRGVAVRSDLEGLVREGTHLEDRRSYPREEVALGRGGSYRLVASEDDWLHLEGTGERLGKGVNVSRFHM